MIIAGGLISHTRNQSDIERLKTDVAELRSARDASAAARTVDQLRLQRVEDNYQSIQTTLSEMKTDIKAIAEKRR